MIIQICIRVNNYMLNSNFMKTVLLMFVMGIMVIAAMNITGCEKSNTTDSKLAEQQEKLMAEGNRQIGMPAIINFQERDRKSVV